MNDTTPPHPPGRGASILLAALVLASLVGWRGSRAEPLGSPAPANAEPTADLLDTGIPVVDTGIAEASTDVEDIEPDVRLPPAEDPPRYFVTPMRASMRVVLRPDMAPGFLTEYGVQLFRQPHFEVDANIGFTVERDAWLPGPWRTISQLDQTYDFLWAPAGRLRLGPTLGLSHRFYRQQWRTIDTAWVPIAGARLSLSPVIANTWGLSIDLKATVDLTRTQFVLETQERRLVSPLELQTGLRFQFGHGRLPSGSRGPTP